MPNWCNNSIEISGPKEKLLKLKQAAIDQEFLNALCPMPESLNDTQHTSDSEVMDSQPDVDGYNNWYDWRLANWSTKWDTGVYDGDETNISLRHELLGKEDGPAQLQFGFDTAWSPPISACASYLEANPDVNIRLVYYEPGMDFMGVWEDFDDRCYTCGVDAPRSDSEFWQTEDGKLIDDYMNCVESLQMYEEEQQEEANATS